jgi:hypothetical protein
MWNLFRRIPCRCTACHRSWNIPRRRILRLERFFDVQPGQLFVWTCLECLRGVVVPGMYINRHGQTVDLDSNNLPKDISVIQI